MIIVNKAYCYHYFISDTQKLKSWKSKHEYILLAPGAGILHYLHLDFMTLFTYFWLKSPVIIQLSSLYIMDWFLQWWSLCSLVQ